MGPSYDVIVVGSGASGAVVAARASENPDLGVLLLEAGPDYEAASKLPEDLLDGHQNSLVDHDWDLEYQPVGGGRAVSFPRGRVTGGSTAVNTTIALRGTPRDYDAWAAAGNTGWSWDEVLPAFNRLERDLDHGGRPYHGDAGPISIRRWRADELVASQAAFLDAAALIGHPSCDDVNAPDAVGAGVMAMNKLGRIRISTAVGYLAPARVRENLDIQADSTAVRVLVENGVAVGVEVEDAGGGRREIRGRLIVLACGAVYTPAVLVRSGIGQADELSALGVTPIATMPGVGANLADHPALVVAVSSRVPELCAPGLPLVQTITRYTSDGSDQDLDVNIELISRLPRPSGRKDGPPLFGLAASLEYVEGRGRIRQQSTDPSSKPVIESAFGSHPADIARHVNAYRDALHLVQQGPLADLIEDVVFPDPARGSGPEQLAELARRTSGSGYHPSGTAKMGPRDDPMAVVDPYGRCHALDGLAIADASIMPNVPRANTNLTSIMIGEKIGEWIRTEPARYGL